MRSTSSPFAVSMMMGTVFFPPRSRRQIDRPSSPGSIRSKHQQIDALAAEQLVHARRIRYGYARRTLLGQIALQQGRAGADRRDNKDFRLRIGHRRSILTRPSAAVAARPKRVLPGGVRKQLVTKGG